MQTLSKSFVTGCFELKILLARLEFYEELPLLSGDRVSSSSSPPRLPFHLPRLLADPLLNFLAYGAAVGFTLEKLGFIPFKRINIDLPDIRRKRSNSAGSESNFA